MWSTLNWFPCVLRKINALKSLVFSKKKNKTLRNNGHFNSLIGVYGLYYISQLFTNYFSGPMLCSVASVTFDSLRSLQPTRLLCPWDFPSKNTRVSYHFLLQGIFPTQGLNPSLLRFLHMQVGIFTTEPLGKLILISYLWDLELFLFF